MKRLIIAIGISGALALAACGKSPDANKSSTTATPAPANEQGTPALSEQQANPTEQTLTTGGTTSGQADQAAFEAGNGVNENADVPANTSEKSAADPNESTNQ